MSDSDSESDTSFYPRTTQPQSFPAYLYPPGTYSLSAISLRAFVLGIVCALSLSLTWSFRASYPQLPFYVACLAFFHFMEYWITAEYNTRRAKVEGISPQTHISHGPRTASSPC